MDKVKNNLNNKVFFENIADVAQLARAADL